MWRPRTARQAIVTVAIAAACGATHIWAQTAPPLGVSESNAQRGLLNAVEYEFPSVGPYAKAFVALPAAGRVAAIETAFAWARRATASAAFQKVYASRREEIKPTPPEFERTVDDELKRQREREAADQVATLAALPAEMRAQMEAVFKQTAAIHNDPQMIAMRRQGIESDRASQQRNYEEAMEAWQRDWPADPLVVVARRLRSFLDVSADVNFDAALVTVNGVRRFADPALEAKSSEWKLCYRAGREAVTAARTQAQAWLQTLPSAR